MTTIVPVGTMQEKELQSLTTQEGKGVIPLNDFH